MQHLFAWRGAARPFIVLVALAFVAVNPKSAHGDRVVTGRVKPTSTANFTSWGLQTTNSNTVPANVLGWNRTQLGPRAWTYTGGSTAPGGGTRARRSGPFRDRPRGTNVRPRPALVPIRHARATYRRPPASRSGPLRCRPGTGRRV